MALEARGNTTSDLLVNLFRGYKSASDETFRKYICDREDDYNDGTLMNLTPEKLMSLAVNKYRTLVDDSAWNQESAQQKQIVALNAQIQNLSATRRSLPPTTKLQSLSKPAKERIRRATKIASTLIGSTRPLPATSQRPNPSKESSFIGANTMNHGASTLRISVAKQRALPQMIRSLQKLPNQLQSCKSTGTLQPLLLMTISEDSARVSFDSAGHSSIYPFLSSLHWHMHLGSRGLSRV